MATTLLGVRASGSSGHAQTSDQIDQASAAFEQGVEAQKRQDWAEAARHFARADEVVADPAALEAALVAVIQSDDAVLGVELAARADRNPYRDKLSMLADRTRQRFDGRVGRIVVHCDRCTVSIDGATTRRGVAQWVTTGAHRVALGVDGKTEHHQVHVEPTAIVTILPFGTRPEVLAKPTSAAPTRRGAEQQDGPTDGLSPAFFWVGLALTGAAGGGTIALALDTKSKHDAFAEAPTEEASIAGQNAETRTNVAFAITAGLGMTTAIVGLFAVDWGEDEQVDGTLLVTPGGARAFATYRF